MAASTLALANRHCICLLCNILNTCASRSFFSPTFPLFASAQKLKIETVFPKLSFFNNDDPRGATFAPSCKTLYP
ncbi:hypothetical protein HanPSC8_Chr05g0214721 [Helianthus annuus]|nr:hypothetical protein HanPSC8_Chr05g0214721 [Helianthus annuus]